MTTLHTQKDAGGDDVKARSHSSLDDFASTISVAEERRLVRKLDRYILPITCLLYLFACKFTPLFSTII